MKQSITSKQFRGLSLKAQKKLFKFFFPKTPKMNIKGCGWEAIDINPEYITIGRMIEFLDEHQRTSLWGVDKKNEVHESFWQLSYGERLIQKTKLCDALWEAVKEELNETS